MDDETHAIYEANAVRWTERRQPRQLDKARDLASRSSAPSIDLGCGPGWYAAVLPTPVVAFDGARSMLDLVAGNAPHASRVQGDLELLPFRRGSFHSAWARNSYVHLARTSVPLAFADLHRTLAVDASLMLALFGGASEGRELFADDDFPGRFFSLWDSEVIVEIVTSAGFLVHRVDVHETGNGEQSIQIEATRARTLPDIVGPGMRVLVCGLNPSLNAADAGVGFARPGNRFWPAALAAGLVSVDRDPWHALRHHRVGFTDLVKRATVGAAELSIDEYRAGFARLERLAAWLEPEIIAFAGLAGWRAAVDRKAVAGAQSRTVGGRPVYVMPSSSGLNAHSSVDSLAEHLRAAAALT